MQYKQVRNFNRAAATTQVGLCLKNVRLGYGINSKYPNAISAWNADTTKQKNGNIPRGVDVPLWYTYKLDGHVNVRLADGRVWSDGGLYNNIDDYLRAKPAVKYLGWSLQVNNVPVIEPAVDIVLASHVEPSEGANVSIKVNTGTWNVRTAPSFSGSVIGLGRSPALGGQQYSAVIQPNGWAQILFTGKTGYISPKTYQKI